MSMMKHGLVLLALAVLCGCAPAAPGPGALGKSRAVQEDDIREAVFRYQLKHCTSGDARGRPLYLSVGTSTKDVSPDDRFMKRFEGHRPPVMKVSECTIWSGTREPVRDKTTGQIGWIIRVGKIKWISKTEAKVPGEIYAGPLAASGNTYRVVFEGGRWVVSEDQPQWVS